MSFDWKKVSLTAIAVPLLAVAVVAASLPTQKTTPKCRQWLPRSGLRNRCRKPSATRSRPCGPPSC